MRGQLSLIGALLCSYSTGGYYLISHAGICPASKLQISGILVSITSGSLNVNVY